MTTPATDTVPLSEPCRIYLVRHGTTMLNRASRYRGRIDVPLDEGGWRDAWTAADQLSGVGLEAVYASPLRRARDTARIIADASGLTTVTDHPGLLNLAYGDWDGKTPDEAQAINPQAYADYQSHAVGAVIPGGESLDLAAQRMLLTMRTLALLHPGGKVAAVSHAATVRLLITATTGSARSRWRRALPNGAVTVFESTGTDTVAIRVPSQVVPVE
ncbi:MAG: histidine phosphatase family protein [Kineosporiaceae bacterium]|nr:histidine phosphatase family protein [Kineosporiaceae bacterium]